MGELLQWGMSMTGRAAYRDDTCMRNLIDIYFYVSRAEPWGSVLLVCIEGVLRVCIEGVLRVYWCVLRVCIEGVY